MSMKQDPGFSVVFGSVPNGQNLLKEEREVSKIYYVLIVVHTASN